MAGGAGLEPGAVTEAHELVDQAEQIGARGGSQNSALLVAVFRFMAAIEVRDRANAEVQGQAMLALVPATLGPYFGLVTAYIEGHMGEAERTSAALGQVGRHAIEALPRDSEWVCWLVQTIASAARAGDAGVVRDEPRAPGAAVRRRGRGGHRRVLPRQRRPLPRVGGGRGR